MTLLSSNTSSLTPRLSVGHPPSTLPSFHKEFFSMQSTKDGTCNVLTCWELALRMHGFGTHIDVWKVRVRLNSGLW